MDARASQLIERLGLVAHPEGGCFRQVYRSSTTVQPADDRGARPSLTTIYFLLVSGEVSRWHRVASDEAWHYYEGDPLELCERWLRASAKSPGTCSGALTTAGGPST